MASRKTTTTRRKTGTTTAKKRRRPSTRKKSSSGFVNFFVPMFFIGGILFCLGFLLFMGYRTVTASSFFDMEKVEVEGVQNLPADEIKKLVKAKTIQDGVWNADLAAIKSEVEKYKYAREVSVSRVLPDTVRIFVKERKPIAIVRIDGSDFWVDEDAVVLEKVSAEDERPPFTLLGWNENNTGKAIEGNRRRVALYRQLLNDWKAYDLASRVKVLDLNDMREPVAKIEKDGKSIDIHMEGQNFARALKKGVETVATLDNCINYVVTDGDKIRYDDSCTS